MRPNFQAEPLNFCVAPLNFSGGVAILAAVLTAFATVPAPSRASPTCRDPSGCAARSGSGGRSGAACPSYTTRTAPPAVPYHSSCRSSSLFTIDLRSSLLTLGIAQTSLALLSLNRSLHYSLFTFHYSLFTLNYSSIWPGDGSSWHRARPSSGSIAPRSGCTRTAADRSRCSCE